MLIISLVRSRLRTSEHAWMGIVIADCGGKAYLVWIAWLLDCIKQREKLLSTIKHEFITVMVSHVPLRDKIHHLH